MQTSSQFTVSSMATRAPASPASAPVRSVTTEPSAWQRALQDQVAAVGEAQATLDGAIAEVRAGRSLSQGELVELQATAYAYSQKVDVATRVIDRSAAAVRQLLNTQL